MVHRRLKLSALQEYLLNADDMALIFDILARVRGQKTKPRDSPIWAF